METKANENREEVPVESVVYSHNTEYTYLEDENRMLKNTVNSLREEINKLKAPPLMLAEVRELNEKNALIRLPNGNEFYVDVSGECEAVKPGDGVLIEQKNLTVVKGYTSPKRFNVDKFVIIEKPKVNWSDIGGLHEQIREIKEVIELPLSKPKLFKKIGIDPPKGILLFGEPGTGKTLLAKAVASSTNSTFIEVVGSELVQKFIGEGAKLVKEMFELARKNAPSVVFIDEIDALAAKRIDIGTSGEREVQRTFMQLLAELDGFKPLDNVKIIGCTNRRDILDPAIIRPGRLDRMVYVPIPDEANRLEILKVHTRKMNIDDDVDFGEINRRMEGFSGAQVKAACTESGYFAIRSDRSFVVKEDFSEAIKKVQEKALEEDEYLAMFG